MTAGANLVSSCFFFHFGMIVTGRSEENHLPKLFSSLMAANICNFEVIRFIGQRSPVTSFEKKLKMVGSGKIIPSKDEDEIGLPARGYLSSDQCRFVIVIDDLEHHRRGVAQQVYDRYRLALDTMLIEEQRCRASVHFLANMLEAYYFADANAINEVLKLALPLTDFEGDVETIDHPKGKLKGLHNGFRERDDGGKILSIIDIEKVLSNPKTCAYLRTLFAWCVKALQQYPYFDDLPLSSKYCLSNGVMSEITRVQIDRL